MPKHQTDLAFTVAGIETEIGIDIEADYQPAEPEVLHPADEAQPGTPEGYEITAVTSIVDGVDLLPLLSEDQISGLEIQLREELAA